MNKKELEKVIIKAAIKFLVLEAETIFGKQPKSKKIRWIKDKISVFILANPELTETYNELKPILLEIISDIAVSLIP